MRSSTYLVALLYMLSATPTYAFLPSAVERNLKEWFSGAGKPESINLVATGSCPISKSDECRLCTDRTTGAFQVSCYGSPYAPVAGPLSSVVCRQTASGDLTCNTISTTNQNLAVPPLPNIFSLMENAADISPALSCTNWGAQGYIRIFDSDPRPNVMKIVLCSGADGKTETVLANTNPTATPTATLTATPTATRTPTPTVTSTDGTAVPTPTATATPVNLTDDSNIFQAGYRCETAGNYRNDITGDSNNNLTGGTGANDTSNVWDGAGSCSFSGTTQLSASGGTATDLTTGLTGSWTICFAARDTLADGSTTFPGFYSTYNFTNGIFFDKAELNDTVRLNFGNTGGGPTIANGMPDSDAANFRYICGWYDSVAGKSGMRIYSGASTILTSNGGVDQSVTYTAPDTSWIVAMSATSGGGLTGNIDDLLVYKGGVLTPAEQCKRCSCGLKLDTGVCTRLGTAFANEGRRTTKCGSCTLPADATASP